MTASDPIGPNLRTADELALLLPRAPHPNTWARWRNDGKKGHKLKATYVLGQWHYDIQDFLTFLAETTRYGRYLAAQHKEPEPCSDIQNSTVESTTPPNVLPPN